MRDRSFTGHSIERPTDEKEAWSVTDKLEWFTTEAAREFVRDNSLDPTIVAVLGFARALVTGYAFIARPSGGERTARYIGYENNFTVDPGTPLLDAAADIDGVTQLCRWRTPHAVPRARYNNLRVVSIPPHTKKRLKNYLGIAKNRRAYATWMVDTIKAHMQPGQRGLVVCKLDLIKNEDVPDWPAGDPRYDDKTAFTEGYGWDIEGRKLCVTHWGTGIGASTWKEAEVVFLFDEFWIPRRIAIATAQGLMGHRATTGPLADLKGYNSPHATVDLLWEGHLLRWLKQMALRGNGRCFDEHGACGQQKLVTSMDRTRLLSNFDRLFPGASIEVVAANTERTWVTLNAPRARSGPVGALLHRGSFRGLSGLSPGRKGANRPVSSMPISVSFSAKYRSLTIFCVKDCGKLNDKLNTKVADFSADRRKS